MCVLQDGFSSGFPCTVSTASIHSDQQGLNLAGAASHSILQGGYILQSMQGNNAVIVIGRQEEHSRVRGSIPRGLRKVMKGRVPVEDVSRLSISNTMSLAVSKTFLGSFSRGLDV